MKHSYDFVILKGESFSVWREGEIGVDDRENLLNTYASEFPKDIYHV